MRPSNFCATKNHISSEKNNKTVWHNIRIKIVPCELRQVIYRSTFCPDIVQNTDNNWPSKRRLACDHRRTQRWLHFHGSTSPWPANMGIDLIWHTPTYAACHTPSWSSHRSRWSNTRNNWHTLEYYWRLGGTARTARRPLFSNQTQLVWDELRSIKRPKKTRKKFKWIYLQTILGVLNELPMEKRLTWILSGVASHQFVDVR